MPSVWDKEGNVRSDLTDRQWWHKGITWFVVIIVLVIGLSLAGWQVGWWFKAENTERQVEIDNSQKGTQTAWRDEVNKTIADFELIDPDNTAARGALVNKACDIIPRLDDPYRDEDIEAFEIEHC